ncbi:aminotransferase class V-fold PLP-dependent enzyme [Clostridium manihotivorum]|uniref:Cysteine desulfurase n=1 Tax=Clostridium manihotivorum TaxID=2320868 RepID=A0A3R5QVA7_9CLOT|nr:aminotransferase class V-fold PLP-dependent enzyme [Clostridium manihotivorum]QAA30299.1 cysteine desulfurase [Clostridium manihotivorum]
MRTIYLNNAFSSYPKTPNLYDNIFKYFTILESNRNFIEYIDEIKSMIEETRNLLCRLVNNKNSSNVIFTSNSTLAINMILKGILNKKDHVIVSSIENDVIMKPINSMIYSGLDISKIPCNESGQLDTTIIPKLINRHTKAIILSHVSNISGTILPLEEIGQICDKYNLFFIVDASQSIGTVEIDNEKLHADAIIFSGNKYLLGPEGIGGFIASDKLISNMSSISTINSQNYSNYMESINNNLELGTLNYMGIYGLNLALKFLLNIGIANIKLKTDELTSLFIKEVLNIGGLKIIGNKNIEDRSCIISLKLDSIKPIEIHEKLLGDGIYTGVGLFCNSSYNKLINTFPTGLLRLSFNYFNTLEDIIFTIDKLNTIIRNIS